MAFKMRSGNRTSFKKMGSAFTKSSPMRVDPPTKEKKEELKISKEARPTEGEEAGYAYEQKYGVKYEDDYDNPDRELPATEMAEAQGTQETTVERSGIDKAWQKLKGDEYNRKKKKKAKHKKDKDVIFADSISEQEKRRQHSDEGWVNLAGTQKKLPTETITDADGTQRKVQFKDNEERDRYMANIDADTGKKVDPWDTSKLEEGQVPEHTEITQVEADSDWEEKAQKMADDPQTKAYCASNSQVPRAFEEQASRKYDMSSIGDGGNQTIMDKDNSKDEAMLKGEVPDFRKRDFKDHYYQSMQGEQRDVEDEIRDTAKTADETGITKEHEAIDFTEFGEGDTGEFSLKNPEKYKDQRTKYVVDKEKGEITEKVKRKGPAGWVGMYKDTGRKKQMKSYQGAAEDKQQENTSKETSSKKPKTKKEKTKKPKKEKTKKPKKEKKKKTTQVYDPARDAWKN